jgi:t-SNARE complex subunit (syntaxin)
MTDVNQEQVVLTEEQKYLQDILAKFNADPEDPGLTEAERVLLKKVVVIEREVAGLVEQFTELNKEVTERQEKMNALNQQLLLKRGQSQGLVESLLALR